MKRLLDWLRDALFGEIKPWHWNYSYVNQGKKVCTIVEHCPTCNRTTTFEMLYDEDEFGYNTAARWACIECQTKFNIVHNGNRPNDVLECHGGTLHSPFHIDRNGKAY